MRRGAILLGLCLGLAGCSGAGALSLLTGALPKVAANGQIGKTNSQTLGATSISEQKLNAAGAQHVEQTGTQQLRANRVDRVVISNGIPWWMWALVGVAIWADSPRRWPGEIIAAFKKK